MYCVPGKERLGKDRPAILAGKGLQPKRFALWKAIFPPLAAAPQASNFEGNHEKL